MARSDFRFVHRLRVRWSEADMQGVVFNAHYLMYFDVAITEYWRALAQGDPATLRDIFDRFYVVRAVCDYHGPARFDDELDVSVRTLRIGRSSMQLGFEIYRGEERLVSGENVYVHAQEGASAEVPEGLRELIRNYETRAPVE